MQYSKPFSPIRTSKTRFFVNHSVRHTLSFYDGMKAIP